MNLARHLAEQLEDHATRVLLVEGAGPSRQAARGGDVLARAAAFRRGLARLRVAPGQRVVRVSGPSIDATALDIACLAEGIVLVPLEDDLPPGLLAVRIAEAAPALVVGPAPADATPGHPATSLQALGAEEATWASPRQVPPDALATVLYPQGARDGPACMLSYGNLAFAAGHLAAWQATLTERPSGHDRALVALPPTHPASRPLGLAALLRGTRTQLASGSDRLDLLTPLADPDLVACTADALEQLAGAAEAAIGERSLPATSLFKAAREADRRAEAEAPSAADRATLALADRLLFAPLQAQWRAPFVALCWDPAPASSARPLLRRLGVSVRRVYGPRECAGLCACAVTPDAPPSTVGRPVDGVEVIRSPDGELWTRGPHVFSGYWARPRATLDAFAWGGWLRTGDVGDVDDEGWWTLTGARRRPARAGSAPAPAPAPHQPSATRQPSRGA